MYRCQSPHHNNDNPPVVQIQAVRCDGRVECYQGLDEEGCQADSDLTNETVATIETGTKINLLVLK